MRCGMIFVTVGSQKFPFNRLLARVDQLVGEGVIAEDVFMQTGTGSFAPQDMNGVSIMVIRRSFSFSIVRAAITAGVVQPKPISIGTNDLPESPIRRRRVSIMKAIRAR